MKQLTIAQDMLLDELCKAHKEYVYTRFINLVIHKDKTIHDGEKAEALSKHSYASRDYDKAKKVIEDIIDLENPSHL